MVSLFQLAGPLLWPATAGPGLRYISAPPPEAWIRETPRTLAVLGSTGSIGVSALKVISAHPDRFRLLALAGGENALLLAEQAAHFRPPLLAVRNGAVADTLRGFSLGYSPTILTGPDGYEAIAALPESSTVLSAQAGAAGLRATLAAVKASKVVCLANKESLVLAGEHIRAICARTGAVILPVDSEHNAVFQALAGRPAEQVRRVVLTASGGPFRGQKREELACVRPEEALRHPNWDMGARITVDSATLMNKGLEVIEACRLYDLPLEKVGVVLHPQSLVHALVEFTDGSFMAQFGMPDMRMPIAHCLGWPYCLDAGIAPLEPATIGTLHFESPDEENFSCLELARRALRQGGGMPVALNAADEVAVERFLSGRIGFLDIPTLITAGMDDCEESATKNFPSPDAGNGEALLAAIEALDQAVRETARTWERGSLPGVRSA